MLGINLSFLKRSKYSTKFNYKKDELSEIIKVNRNVINDIGYWIADDVLEKSIYQYGVPDYLKHLLNIKINDEPTYTDIIAYYSRFLNNINYLELGVSVGKNFYQLLSFFENSILTGFDIEEINPILSDKLSFDKGIEWKAKAGSLKIGNYSLKEFKYNSNKVNYVAADIWDENSWAKLEGNKYNIIFSDALHDPKALLFEYEMIKKYDLLADKFLFFWDDLANEMRDSFFQIAEDLKKTHNLKSKNIHLVKINGWLGQNEVQHDVGLITNIDIN